MVDYLKKIIERIIAVADLDKIILFGSRVSGKAKERRDYDICVLKSKVIRRRKPAQQIYLALDVKAPVDIIVETPKRFNELKEFDWANKIIKR
ncbi:MAG: nucleotidyltransferase domain-containing protein [Candidatus Thermoplasmatota archaeon]